MPRRARKIEESKAGAKDRRLTTAVTYSGDELAVLAEYVAAGLVILRVTTPHPAVSKLKAALSRLGIKPPHGL